MLTENKRETILIVDDEELNRAILANLFDDVYDIIEAENGLEGLECIRQLEDRLCAVLLDVVMPEMDRLTVLKHLNRQGLPQKVPCFLITAAQDDATIREAYQLGVMDVISKPVIPYVVQRRVNSVVELFQARRQLGAKVQQQ